MEHLEIVEDDENLHGIGSDAVRRFLLATTTPEHIGLFTRANQLLARWGVEFIEREAENILTYAARPNSEPADALYELEGFFDTTLRVWLKEKRLRVNNDTQFKDLVPLAEALYDLENTEESDSVLRFLDTGTEPIGQLVKAFELVVGESCFKFYNDIIFVDVELIQNLRALHEARAQQLEEEAETITPEEATEDARRIRLVRRLMEVVNSTDFHFATAVMNGIEIGLPFLTYINYYKDAFVVKTDQQIAVELLGFYLISDGDGKDVLKTIDTAYELILDSEQRAMQIRSMLPRILAAVNQTAI